MEETSLPTWSLSTTLPHNRRSRSASPAARGGHRRREGREHLDGTRLAGGGGEDPGLHTSSGGGWRDPGDGTDSTQIKIQIELKRIWEEL
jgi:hypothetical protein